MTSRATTHAGQSGSSGSPQPRVCGVMLARCSSDLWTSRSWSTRRSRSSTSQSRSMRVRTLRAASTGFGGGCVGSGVGSGGLCSLTVSPPRNRVALAGRDWGSVRRALQATPAGRRCTDEPTRRTEGSRSRTRRTPSCSSRKPIRLPGGSDRSQRPRLRVFDLDALGLHDRLVLRAQGVQTFVLSVHVAGGHEPRLGRVAVHRPIKHLRHGVAA
jgi:hypothetical protein